MKIQSALQGNPKDVLNELRDVANHVNTRPNSLGNTDSHKIGFSHRQLNPSQIGKIDLYESVKDVGQTSMLSPYADLTDFRSYDRDKYPNIKYDLYKFIKQEFEEILAVEFHCSSIEEYNDIIDKLCHESIITLDHFIPDLVNNSELFHFIKNSKGGF